MVSDDVTVNGNVLRRVHLTVFIIIIAILTMKYHTIQTIILNQIFILDSHF
jgi:hypothetical protein